MHSQRRALLLNSVVALFILEGLYYLYRILVTLLTDQQLVLDARLVCIPIAVGLLSRRKAWGGIALVYVALAVIGTLYVLRAVLLFVPGPMELAQIVGFPIRQLAPEVIIGILCLLLIVRLYQLGTLIGVFIIKEAQRVKE